MKNGASNPGRLENGFVWSLITAAILSTFVWRSSLLSLPLWIDESWTAVLSSAPDLRSFIHQMWLDSNAPLYYFIIWLWPFESNLGLRVPSALFTVCASLVAAAWAPLQYRRRLFLGTLLFLWLPALSLFVDARYYALLYLITTAQTFAFARLVAEPDLKRAAFWTALSTLAVLTHYYAAIPAVVQGIYFLIRWPRPALSVWPTALITAPAFGWFGFHWPRLKLYAEAGISWYERLNWTDAVGFLLWPLGGGILGGAVLLLALLFRERDAAKEPILAVGGTALISALILIAAGMAAPVFTQRYLTPLAPPMLFCVAALARPLVFVPIVAVMFVPTMDWRSLTAQLRERSSVGLQEAAAKIPSGRKVVWMIDYRGSRIHEPEQMGAMLRDAFARNGKQVIAVWGTDLDTADAFIVLDHGAAGRPLTVPHWPCRSASGWGHSSLVCLKQGDFSP